MSDETKKGFLREITEAAVGHLGEVFEELDIEGISILARHKGHIQDLITGELSRLGIYVFVWPCVPVRTNANLPGPYFDQIQLRMEVGEDPTINNTGMTAEYLCEILVGEIPKWDPDIAGLNPFWPPDDCITDAQDPDLNAYIVTLRASTGFAAPTTQDP